MRLFDTHMHLDDEQFDSCRDEVLQRAEAAGVVGIVAVGTNLESSRRVIALAEQYPLVHAAVGIQPNYTHEAATTDWQEVEQLSQHPRVVAIGETGLDHYWDMAPLDLQRDYFERHLQLAIAAQLPVIIHMREPRPEADPICEISCAEDILDSLQRNSVHQGVMHSYTGDVQMCDRFVEQGLHISFAGMVTYKKSDELRDVARRVPDDRLLIETDAPYLSPHPKRGQRPNEPALVAVTAECLAGVRGMPIGDLAELTTANAASFFGIGSL